MYDEPAFHPSVPELVIVHMVFAIIYFQYGVRNWEHIDQRAHLNDVSNKHYHFALSKFYELTACRSLVAVQALALIASHTRAFPKPGCGAIVANSALQAAIEINLHRASKKPDEGTDLQNELRKRTWWVILAVSMAVTGRQGRPMPITVEEFDTQFPEPIADELLSDQGVDTSRSMPCTYLAGIAGFKIVPIFMEVYSNIYSVRRDRRNYANIVHTLEEQLQKWEDDLPASLNVKESQTNVAALYMKTFQLEVRLCLRHPSMAMTTDEAMIADNTRICEETAREMLHYSQEILKLKALDTTWYQMSVYALSMFSMLVAHWERRSETTSEQVTVLRQEMNSWMEIIKETSLLLGKYSVYISSISPPNMFLGSGPEISTQIDKIINRTIDWIERDMGNKDIKMTDAEAVPPSQPKYQPHSQPQSQAPSHPHSAPDRSIKQEHLEQTPAFQQTPAAMPLDGNGQSNDHKGYFQAAPLNGQPSYPTLGYGEQDQSSMSHPAYQPSPSMYYNPSGEAAAVAALPDGPSSQANPLVAFASQATQHVDGSSASAQMMWDGRDTAWNNWTSAVVHGNERYGANALMSLGNGARDASMLQEVSGHAAGDGGVVQQGEQWPLILFDHGLPSGSQHHQ